MNDAIQNANPIRRFRHLAVTALVYGVALMVSILLIDLTMGKSMALGVPMAISCLVLLAIWSVFGPGSFTKRILWSFAAGIFLAGCAATGFHNFTTNLMGGESSLIYCLEIAAIATLVLTVAVQVPFWFFRFIAGWRITYKNESSNHSVSLGEMFAILFVFSLAFAAPQLGDKLSIREQQNQIKIGSDTLAWTQQPDGSMSANSVTVTRDNIKELKSNVVDNPFIQISGILVNASISIVVLTLFCLPLFWFAFRTKMAFLYSLIYGSACLAIVAFVVNLFQGGFMGIIQPLAIYTTVLVLGISTPLMISRSRGFSLTSSRNPGMVKKENAEQPSESSLLESQSTPLNPLE